MTAQRRVSLDSRRADIEAEYDQPLEAVVRGYLIDDQQTVTLTAACLECSVDELLQFCSRHGIPAKPPAASTARYLLHGEPISTSELARRVGISRCMMRKRLNKSGFTPGDEVGTDDILRPAIYTLHLYELNGEPVTLSRLSRMLAMSRKRLRSVLAEHGISNGGDVSDVCKFFLQKLATHEVLR